MSTWTDKDGRRHAAVMLNGRRLHRRLPEGATASDAKSVEAELRRALGKRTVVIPGDPSMAEVMGMYMEHAKTLRSQDTAEYHALRAGPWLVENRASDAPIAVQKMIDDMRQAYKPATINRSIGTVKKALTLAYNKGLTPYDYGDKIRRLPENNAVHTYLTIKQVRMLADHASEQTRAAIWIALLTGCRRGEILAIQPGDIGRDTITIRAGNTKTLRERVVPIIPALRPWLKYLPLQMNYEGLKSGFRRAREAAGLQTVRFHDLRHSCASLLINLGVDLAVIRDILGHTTVKTTERYAHLVVDRQRDALKQLGNAVGNKR